MKKVMACMMLAAWVWVLGMTAAEAQQQDNSTQTQTEWICPVTGKPAGMGMGRGGRGQCMRNRDVNCPQRSENCPHYSQSGRRGGGAGRAATPQDSTN